MGIPRRIFCATLGSLGVAAAWPGWAQTAAAPAAYPSKAIRYVVPFPAGGLTDVMARLLGQKLSESLQQTVVVDNKPGANANLGADLVAKATPDGYTWLAVTLAHAVNPSLFAQLPYSVERDLAPVALLATSPLVLVVHNSFAAHNLQEFLAEARRRPLNGGSSGNGTPPHLGLELLAGNAKLDVTHVPYKGGAPSLNDLMGNQIDFIVSNLPESAPFIQSGKLRALAVTSAQRHALLPNVPTFAEQGLAKMELENWTGLMVPAGTPRAIIDKVAEQALRMVQSPAIVQRVAAQGFTVKALGPDAFASILAQDLVRWREIVKARNIQANG